MPKHKTISRLKDVLTFLEMPGHLLRRCQQIAVAVFLEECQAYELTPPQFATLATLAAHGALDKATIGRIAALDRTTMSVVLGNLRDRGLVTTEPSEHDKRAKSNEITAAGLAVLAAAQPNAAHAQERLLAPLTPAERTELVRLLAKVAHENNLLSRAPVRAHRVAAE